MFCKHCGHKIPNDSRFCIYCGKKIDNEVVANDEVDMPCEEDIYVKDNDMSAVAREPKASKVKERLVTLREDTVKNKGRIINIVKKSLCLLIALLVFVSCFTPIMTYKVGETAAIPDGDYLDNDFKKKNIGYSPVEVIQLTFDSFKSYETPMDDPLYDKVEDITDELSDVRFDRMSNKDMKAVTKYLKLNVRMMIRLETYPTRLGIIAAGVVSLLFMVYSVVLFIFVLLSLLSELNILNINGKKIDAVAMKLFFLIPVFTILLYVLSYNILGDGGIKLHIGGLYMTNIILSVLVAMGMATYNVVLNHSAFTVKEYVMRGIIVVLCIVMLSIVFSPFVITKYEVDENGRSRTAVVKDSYAYYNIFTVNEDTKNMYDDFHDAHRREMETTINNRIENITNYYSVRDINRGAAAIQHQQLANLIVAGDFLNYIRFVNQLMVVFVALFALSAIYIMMAQIAGLNNNNDTSKSNRAVKIIALLAAILALAYSAVFIITGSSVLDMLKVKDCTLAIGAAPICMFIFALILMFIPSKFTRDRIVAKPASVLRKKYMVNTDSNAKDNYKASVSANNVDSKEITTADTTKDNANDAPIEQEISDDDIVEVELDDIVFEDIKE